MLVTLVVMLLGAWRSADACDCMGSLEDGIARAEAVFWGEIVATAPHDKYGKRFTVEVKGVWKGTVRKRTIVVTEGTSCGLTYVEADVHFLFVATKVDGALSVNQCDGSQKATKKVRDEVTKIAGTARPPS
jgi:hypothetical protein